MQLVEASRKRQISNPYRARRLVDRGSADAYRLGLFDNGEGGDLGRSSSCAQQSRLRD